VRQVRRLPRLCSRCLGRSSRCDINGHQTRVPTETPGTDQGQPTNLAHAQDLAGLPKTATGWQWHILLGLSALMLAAWLRGRRTAVL